MGAANETAKDETVNASSVSNLHYESGYRCYLPLNCYVGHGADDIDYVGDVPSISACAEACTALSQCEGFVYMGTQQKCMRRRNITRQRAIAVSGTQRSASLSRACTWISERLHSAPLHMHGCISHKLASMIRIWRQVTRAPLPCTAISCRRYVESASVDDV